MSGNATYQDLDRSQMGWRVKTRIHVRGKIRRNLLPQTPRICRGTSLFESDQRESL